MQQTIWQLTHACLLGNKMKLNDDDDNVGLNVHRSQADILGTRSSN